LYNIRCEDGLDYCIDGGSVGWWDFNMVGLGQGLELHD